MHHLGSSTRRLRSAESPPTTSGAFVSLITVVLRVLPNCYTCDLPILLQPVFPLQMERSERSDKSIMSLIVV